MYPLPEKLSARILEIIKDVNLSPEEKNNLYNQIAALIVRENRTLRAVVLEMIREFASVADKEEYPDNIPATMGEETARHIVNEIVDAVYYNTNKEDKRQEVENFIRKFYEQDN